MVSLELVIDIKPIRSHNGPGVNSVSNRNEYKEDFHGGKGARYGRLTNLPPSCALVMKSGNLKYLEPSGPVQSCNGTDLPLRKDLHSAVVSLTVHAASQILAFSVTLCEVLSSSSGVPRNFVWEGFNKFIWGLRTDLYLYTLYFSKKDATPVLCLFHLDVSCGEMLGLIQSQVFPWMCCLITRLLIKFAENLTHWMCRKN